MNNVNLIGNVAYKDIKPNVGTIRIAVDRYSEGTDFITVKLFGKTKDICDQYVDKGRKVGISGRLSSGSYEKDGTTYYTQEVIASTLYLL